MAAGDLPTERAGVSDIVERLRSLRHIHVPQLSDEAADEIERLRADWPEQLQAHSVLIAEQELEIERLRQVVTQKNMNDAERDVLREVCRVYADEDDVGCNEIAFVIDRLLERLWPAANNTPDRREACGESRTGSDDAKAVEGAAECTVTSRKLPERDRLTAEERNAVAYYLGTSGPDRFHATLRGLLARTK